MAKRTKSVSFRLADDVLQLLKERADAVNLSHGEMARSMVISSLCGSPSDDHSATLDRLEETQRELLGQIGKSDKKLAYLLYVLLTHIGKIDPSEAQATVKQQFLRRLEDLV
jgi:hypothetical protein